jgi:hypothetical protein
MLQSKKNKTGDNHQFQFALHGKHCEYSTETL